VTTPGEAPATGKPVRQSRQPSRRRRWIAVSAAGAAFLLVVAAVTVFFVLPWYVRSQCIAEAAAHGITLTIDDASIDSGGFRLIGVQATTEALPGTKAVAPEIEVTTHGLSPQMMTVRRGELTLAGKWSAVEATLASWRAGPTGAAVRGGAWAPESLVVDESRIVWPAPFAQNARVEAANVHLDATWNGPAPQLHARSDNVTVALAGGKLGPWRVDAERGAGASRLRLSLDPSAPDTCTVLFVQTAAGATSVDAAIPRSPVARLGLQPALLGLKGKSLQAEVNAHYAPLGPQRADLTAKGGVYGIDANLPAPLDVTWELAATGAPGTGLQLDKSRLAAGPLAGALTGTVKPFADGFRADLAWSATAVPCTAFDGPTADGDPFDIAFQLRKLAGNVGMIQGDVSARGTLSFDSRDLAGARVNFTPEVRCKVALFGM
jgi:hypothetical protein